MKNVFKVGFYITAALIGVVLFVLLLDWLGIAIGGVLLFKSVLNDIAYFVPVPKVVIGLLFGCFALSVGWACGKLAWPGRFQDKKASIVVFGLLIIMVVGFEAHRRKSRWFDQQTGQAKYFGSQTPEGAVIISPEGGFDPKTGKRLTPVTPEIFERAEALRKGQSLTPVPVDPHTVRWFSPINGDSELYYSEEKGSNVLKWAYFRGVPEMFHPVRGVKLKPVTLELRAQFDLAAAQEREEKEKQTALVQQQEDERLTRVAAEQKAKLNQERERAEQAEAASKSKQRAEAEAVDRQRLVDLRERYLVGSRAKSTLSKKVLGVAIVDVDASAIEREFGDMLAAILKGDGFEVDPYVFKSAAATDGILDKIINGDKSIVADLLLGDLLDNLIVGKTTTAVIANPVHPDLKSVEINSSIQLFSIRDGKLSKVLKVKAVGAHFRIDMARKMAWERLLQQIKKENLEALL